MCHTDIRTTFSLHAPETHTNLSHFRTHSLTRSLQANRKANYLTQMPTQYTYTCPKDGRPQRNTSYFRLPGPEPRAIHQQPGRGGGATVTAPNVARIGVVIPFYNEGPHDLQRTLMSLQRTIEDFLRAQADDPFQVVDNPTRYEFHTLIIQDGWRKAHSEMPDFLTALFPDSDWKQQVEGKVGCGDVGNFIISNRENNDAPAPVDVSVGWGGRAPCPSARSMLNVTLMVK